VERAADGTLRGPGGIVLRAAAPAAGGKLKGVLRHEKLRLGGSVPEGANQVPAEIVLRSFAGASALYVLRLDGGAEWQAELPAEIDLPQGTRTTAWFLPSDLILVPDDAA
jgi:hypothetical protein